MMSLSRLAVRVTHGNLPRKRDYPVSRGNNDLLHWKREMLFFASFAFVIFGLKTIEAACSPFM